jgi:hypothetical protein
MLALPKPNTASKLNSFMIATSDRKAGKVAVVTLGFTPTNFIVLGSIVVGNLRLSSCNSGGCCRVEILYGGSWGTICDDNFQDKEARVVCRNLGFSSGTSYTAGFGSGPIWLDDVNCPIDFTGFIGDCSHNGWGSHDCYHSEDVGVCCV